MALSEFETIPDLVAAGRNREGTLLEIEGRQTPYSYHDVCTNTWKAGNLFCHYGVHVERELAVLIGPKAEASRQDTVGYIDAAEPLLAVLGGAIVGGVVDTTPTEPIETSVLVGPAHWDIETRPGCSQLAYGGPPEDPEISHFERDVWSENPIEPPESVTPDQPVLQGDDRVWTHDELLTAVEDIVDEYQIDAATTVTPHAPLTEPGALVAGVLAGLAVGATIKIPEYESTTETDSELCTVEFSDEKNGDRRLEVADLTDSLHGTDRA